VFNLLRNKLHNNIILLTSVTTLLLVSSFGISNLPSNNQAYATIEENNKITDSIKKACPNYEGNGNFKGLVTDIIKACLGNSNQPPSIPGPSPTAFPQNYVNFVAEADASGLEAFKANITIRDNSSNYLQSYLLSVDEEFSPTDQVTDLFIIPVGDQFDVSVSLEPPTDQSPYVVNVGSESCQQVPYTTKCVGTMGVSNEHLSVGVGEMGPPPVQRTVE